MGGMSAGRRSSSYRAGESRRYDEDAERPCRCREVSDLFRQRLESQSFRWYVLTLPTFTPLPIQSKYLQNGSREERQGIKLQRSMLSSILLVNLPVPEAFPLLLSFRGKRRMHE